MSHVRSFSTSSLFSRKKKELQHNQFESYAPPACDSSVRVSSRPATSSSDSRRHSAPPVQLASQPARNKSFLSSFRRNSMLGSIYSNNSSVENIQSSRPPSIRSVSSFSRSIRNSRIISGSQEFSSTSAPIQQAPVPNQYRQRTMSRTSLSSFSVIHSDAGSVASATVPAPKFDLAKSTPQEMVPILTLLHAQKQRTYYEGYFMILNDLNSDGKPSAERRWVEVFGKLTGTVLAVWDAESLEHTPANTNPTPTYINITDSTFKSIATLPSSSGTLSNLIVLSTTLKNRYLLQFANGELLRDWTAALRLSIFEYTSLQEAYTGALLSAKGSKLNGIRTLLTETKFAHEDWVSVRFGAGMPWKKCWTVVTPPGMKKKKHMPPPGTISFYENKKTKRAPLAMISGSYATYAVYPQNTVLVNGSTLIKVEGKVSFNDVEGEKDAAVFIMPEAHPGVPGYETLIRFLIPVLDVFRLYGRPERLNANKNDMRSLLFAMPTLPYSQYLEFGEAREMAGEPGSENWTAFEWTKQIKEHLQRRLGDGYRGCGRMRNSRGRVSTVSVRGQANSANDYRTEINSAGGYRNEINTVSEIDEVPADNVSQVSANYRSQVPDNRNQTNTTTSSNAPLNQLDNQAQQSYTKEDPGTSLSYDQAIDSLAPTQPTGPYVDSPAVVLPYSNGGVDEYHQSPHQHHQHAVARHSPSRVPVHPSGPRPLQPINI